MKRILLAPLCAVALLAAMTSCTSNGDSVEQAQKTNEARHENATANTDMGDMKQDKKDFDSDFMTKAASGGMLEVELGRLVAQRGATPEGKQFGQHMVDDHSKANEELKALASQKNITLPSTLGEDHREVLDDVTDEKGVDMDKKYLKEMVKDHEEDVKEYTEASTNASDPDIKAFAAKNVPILKQHLAMAQKMYAAVEQRK
ncbi:DUF4142 domain-containing protein [Hymenobacter profundi]|uniref:DUF4142 domain-containing protein n=1 Tax=Hymenobacter profundi TaxID=1982110 RepID=A0ABS6X5V0_9BACT|nr:DUF4142 domain-containing protein [Hymenobacter profundi]MBW3130691.1 DUF4142 domain-containing protein [Hymenobacter profundi]